MKLYNVDMEDPRDPYGVGIGYVLQVMAPDRATAKRKANAAWPSSRQGRAQGGAYSDYRAFDCSLAATFLSSPTDVVY